MSQQSAPGNNDKVPAKGKAALIPPEEKFWQRYSPHHEFPLSTVTSVCLYALGGLLVWALVAFAIQKNDDGGSLPVQAIEVPGGGGGSPDGREGDTGPGDAPPAHGKEAVAETKPDTPVTPPSKDSNLAEVQPAPVDLPELRQPDGRIIEASQEAVQRFARVPKETREKLFAGPGPSKGEGGPGRGGGKGRGVGTGEGDGIGPGKGKLSPRQERALRWVMLFNTLNGNDYLNQLRSLGAILAIPDGQGGHLVIRDLNRLPAHGEKEDLQEIKRLFWVDDKPESVRSLAMALKLPVAPSHFVAFFPEKLEKELLDKELKYSRGHAEQDIQETRFKVVRSGSGYEARVDSQQLKKR